MACSLMIAPIDFAGHQKIAARQFFDNYAFFELIPKQAKEYFLWYKSEIPNRIALLWEYMKRECPEAEPFDYLPESLIPLWEWYETKIGRVPMTAKEIESRVKIFPLYLESEIRKNTNKFTDETLSLFMPVREDSGVYMADKSDFFEEMQKLAGSLTELFTDPEAQRLFRNYYRFGCDKGGDGRQTGCPGQSNKRRHSHGSIPANRPVSRL